MKNYLCLKVSDAPVKVGDLTYSGIITERISKEEFVTNEAMIFMWDDKVLIPLLIMDAPEYERYGDDKAIDRRIWRQENIPNAIPFHSNQEVYEYLQSKGIKPEAEMLIEFDGEVEIKYKCIGAGFLGNCEASLGECSNCSKVALIKQPVQESEEDYRIGIGKIFDGIDREETDDPDGGWWVTSKGAKFGADKMKELIEYLQRFKIERRK